MFRKLRIRHVFPQFNPPGRHRHRTNHRPQHSLNGFSERLPIVTEEAGWAVRSPRSGAAWKTELRAQHLNSKRLRRVLEKGCLFWTVCRCSAVASRCGCKRKYSYPLQNPGCRTISVKCSPTSLSGCRLYIIISGILIKAICDMFMGCIQQYPVITL